MRRNHPASDTVISLAAACLILLVAVPGFTQTPPAQLPPGIAVQIEARPPEGAVGDPIQILLDIVLPEGDRLQLAEPAKQIGDFALLEFNPGPELPSAAQTPGTSPPKLPPQPNKNVHHQARLVVAVYKTGDFIFPGVQATLRTPDGKEVVFSSPGVKIRINSILTEKDRALKGLKSQAEIPEGTRWLRWLGWAALLLALGLAAWWLWRRRSVAGSTLNVPGVDPLDLAEKELRNLAEQKLLENGWIKQYHISLSHIAKMILQGGYGIQTEEKTTCEIMDELHSCLGRDGSRLNSQSGQAELAKIEALLSACDLVKFAKYVPSREESDSRFTQTSELLETCRNLRTLQSTSETHPVPGAS